MNNTENIINNTENATQRPAVSSVAKRMLSVREVRGSILGPVKST